MHSTQACCTNKKGETSASRQLQWVQRTKAEVPSDMMMKCPLYSGYCSSKTKMLRSIIACSLSIAFARNGFKNGIPFRRSSISSRCSALNCFSSEVNWCTSSTEKEGKRYFSGDEIDSLSASYWSMFPQMERNERVSTSEAETLTENLIFFGVEVMAVCWMFINEGRHTHWLFKL